MQKHKEKKMSFSSDA